MEHADAIGSGAAERYVLGEMTDRERDAYEAHYFACEECADEVKLASAFVDHARPVLERAVSPLRFAPAVPDTSDRPDVRRWWAGVASWFWPLPAGAAAAAVLVACFAAYQAFIVVPGFRKAVEQEQGLQAASWHFLSVARGDTPVVRIVPGTRQVGLTLSRTLEQAFPFYLVELRNASDAVVLADVLLAPPAGVELQIVVPARALAPGTYTVAVAGTQSRSTRPPASDYVRYRFTVEFGAAGGGR